MDRRIERNVGARQASPPARNDGARGFAIVFAGTIILGVAAFGLGFALETSPLTRLSWSVADAAVGGAATAPLFLALSWFMRTKNVQIARFRNAQLDFFEEIGFRLTTSRIVLLSLAAGLSEELLFRGLLQDWIDGFAPLWLAIAVPNIVFGALHGRTTLYAVVAGVVGVWFGAIFAFTGNLLAPMAAHALYDAVALDVTRRELDRRRLDGDAADQPDGL